jgi:hypothetical protein
VEGVPTGSGGLLAGLTGDVTHFGEHRLEPAAKGVVIDPDLGWA